MLTEKIDDTGVDKEGYHALDEVLIILQTLASHNDPETRRMAKELRLTIVSRNAATTSESHEGKLDG